MPGILKIARLAAFLPVVAALWGCTPTTLVRLDNEWAQTYRAKMQSVKDADDYLATTSNYEAQFADLSQRAAEAGNKAVPDDPQMAVGFYRIAVLGAWKSAELAEDKVPDLADKGAQACARLPNKTASQPRDCMLFRLVESLAGFDKKRRELDPLMASAKARPDHDLPSAQLEVALPLHSSIAGLFDTIGERRKEMAGLALPSSFHHYVNRNWNDVFCSTLPLVNAISHSLPDDSPKKKAVIDRGRSMQDALRTAGIRLGCQ